MHKFIKLPNNVRIVYENIPFLRSITMGLWVGNGSRYETKDVNGISHFIEHMMFKGTENRKASDIAAEMDSVGGQINAFTSKEYTCYYARVLSKHFDLAIDILSDMYFNSLFSESELEKEKRVILEEINMYEDSPEDLVHDLLQESIYGSDSLGYPILGTKATLNSIDRNKMTEYFNTHYTPSNLVIAVSGNFDEDYILKKITDYFGNFKRELPYTEPVYDTKYHKSFTIRQKDVEQLHISMGFEAYPSDSKSVYCLSALNTIFGSGMSSRLFQKVREEHGLAYSIYGYSNSYKKIGTYTIYAGLSKENAEKTINLIIEEIKNLYKDRITEEILSKTKEQLVSSYLMSLDNAQNRMQSLGRSELLFGRIYQPDELTDIIRSTTLPMIYDAISHVFDFDKMSFSAVGNTEGVDFERIFENAR